MQKQEARMTIGKHTYTDTEAAALHKAHKYIVTYSSIYQICYSNASRYYYALRIHEEPGLTKRGTVEHLTAAEINKRFNCDFLAENIY